MSVSPLNEDGGGRGILILSVAAMFALIVSVNIALSLLHGHLAMIASYDDVNYMADALTRLRFADGHGLQSVAGSFLADPPHAPVTTVTGMLGFWLFGPEPVAAYVANSWVVLVFLLFLAWLSRPVGSAVDRALFIATFLFVPVVHALVMEFRPDLPGGLLLAIALYGLATTDFVAATWRRKLAVAGLCLAATITKPSAFILVFPALVIGLALVVLRAVLFERRAMRSGLVAIAEVAAIFVLLLAPFALIWGPQTYDYVYGVLITYADVWRTTGDTRFHLLYHSFGFGGQLALGRFLRYGLLLIAVDLGIWIFAPQRRQRGTIAFYGLVAMLYGALAMSGEKTLYQGSFFYLPFVIAFAGASARILAFMRAASGSGWLVRGPLVAILAFYAWKLPLASYYDGALPNAPKLPPIVERIRQRLVDISLANAGNPACSGRPIRFAFTDSLPIPTELVRFEAAKVGIPLEISVTFMARDLPAMTTLADEADMVLIADPGHASSSRWLPGVTFNPQLFEALKSSGESGRFELGSDGESSWWLIVNPRCLPHRSTGG